ncbi:hypothetical protein H920_19830 [Fukomys damarensis]|uniref:Uncharacterized protein n=1 Tax=Fukomys damarensis TaxID=885580 RepID=A0A091D7J5_FUKDA|nr:hypothetical protein H920_19830 [Fukomys damarensis]
MDTPQLGRQQVVWQQTGRLQMDTPQLGRQVVWQQTGRLQLDTPQLGQQQVVWQQTGRLQLDTTQLGRQQVVWQQTGRLQLDTPQLGRQQVNLLPPHVRLPDWEPPRELRIQLLPALQLLINLPQYHPCDEQSGRCQHHEKLTLLSPLTLRAVTLLLADLEFADSPSAVSLHSADAHQYLSS